MYAAVHALGPFPPTAAGRTTASEGGFSHTLLLGHTPYKNVSKATLGLPGMECYITSPTPNTARELILGQVLGRHVQK